MSEAQQMASINRTAGVVLRYAPEPVDAAEVLLGQFGFDVAFLAVASNPTPAASAALWSALCCLAFDDAIS